MYGGPQEDKQVRLPQDSCALPGMLMKFAPGNHSVGGLYDLLRIGSGPGDCVWELWPRCPSLAVRCV